MDISEFTVDNMTPLVGSTWQLETPDGQTFDLHLKEVLKTLDKHVDQRFKRDSFSLQFVGPSGVYLPQATYAMTHEQTGGPNPIFLVPTGREGDAYRYEAIFT
jgi:hypothetical protein